MYVEKLFKVWTEEQRLRAPTMKSEPAFYRNLEQVLDTKRQGNYIMGFKPRWDHSIIDYTTNDFLSLSRSGRIREAFLEELANQPNFDLAASGSRIQYGNYDYLVQVEREIAAFHGAESCYITHTGFGANASVLAGVPQAGDAIVYDSLVHASTHDGMALSLAAYKMPFRHNDPDALRDVLVGLKESQPAFATGTSNVLVCCESIYSMDGDVAPLREYVQIVKEEFPLGNAQFVVDEAHSLGVVGENGRGLVSLLGLEQEIAIRIFSASKALASVGGLVLSKGTIRYMLANGARAITFSCAPSFPMVASIRVGYKFLIAGATKEQQERIQTNVKFFFRALLDNPAWEEAVDEGLMFIPLLEDYEERPFQAHIVPLRTRNRHEQFVTAHLLLNGMNAYPMAFPVVAKGQTRVRLIFHAHNTFEQVQKLADTICEFASEMLAIERGESDQALPSSIRQVYARQAAVAAKA